MICEIIADVMQTNDNFMMQTLAKYGYTIEDVMKNIDNNMRIVAGNTEHYIFDGKYAFSIVTEVNYNFEEPVECKITKKSYYDESMKEDDTVCKM